VDVSWERIIRTTVGLRPHRDSGFLLKAEKFDDKMVVHNFGHGGAGMSLSWGTAFLATELSLEHSERRAAVLGAGIAGLTTARQLQRHGFAVTIYAAALPPNTTSNMSLASFTPTSGLTGPRGRTPEWDAQFRRAVEIAYREHQLLVGRAYGVSWIDEYTTANSAGLAGRSGGRAGSSATGAVATAGAASPPAQSNALLPPDVELGRELLLEGQHPFATRYARRFPTLRFEPSIYLEALMRDVLSFGGRLVVRQFDTLRDIALLPESVVVNCTGLGAKTLFGDAELTPVKGQLVVLVPQAEVTYATANMLPRSDGIILGHVMQPGVATLDVDEEARTRVVQSAMNFFAAMRMPASGTGRGDRVPAVYPTPIEPRPAYRPAQVPPVESFFGLES
jgi:glycine/D-amino acid oxidase-like deaminating enzyme